MLEKAKSSLSKDTVEGEMPHRLNPLSPHWVASPVVPSPPRAGASYSTKAKYSRSSSAPQAGAPSLTLALTLTPNP